MGDICVIIYNQWDGSWLRRGVDVITDNGEVTTNIRHANYIENDEVDYLVTESLNSVTFPVSTNVTFLTETKPGYAVVLSNGVAQTDNWATQMWYQFAEPLKAGTSYTFKCKGKATSAYDCGIFLQSSTTDTQQYGLGMSFTTDWTDLTMTFTPDSDDIDKITFNIGDFVGDITIDDVSFVQTGTDKELIANGDFENGQAAETVDGKTVGWTSWTPGVPPCVEGAGYYVPSVKEEVKALTCDLRLTFSESGDCTITSATEGITASGTGKYVKDGEKLAWGNKDRDGIYLDYQVDFGPKQIAAKDTLVSRSREITMELYVPSYKE